MFTFTCIIEGFFNVSFPYSYFSKPLKISSECEMQNKKKEQKYLPLFFYKHIYNGNSQYLLVHLWLDIRIEYGTKQTVKLSWLKKMHRFHICQLHQAHLLSGIPTHDACAKKSNDKCWH